MSKQAQTGGRGQPTQNDDVAMRGHHDDVAMRAAAGPDEMEAADHAATQQQELDGLSDNQIADTQSANDETATGVRARRVLTMKSFIVGDHLEWIMRNVVGKGRGTHVSVGRLYGKAARTERNVTKWSNKGEEKLLTSVRIEGMFEAIALLTGEVTQCTAVYLPLAFAEQIEMAVATNPGAIIDIDVDIGVEATGKGIPFEWTVTSFINGAAERAMRAMRNRRPTALSSEAMQRLSLSGPTGAPN
jgi:hypothetical protein